MSCVCHICVERLDGVHHSKSAIVSGKPIIQFKNLLRVCKLILIEYTNVVGRHRVYKHIKRKTSDIIVSRVRHAHTFYIKSYLRRLGRVQSLKMHKNRRTYMRFYLTKYLMRERCVYIQGQRIVVVQNTYSNNVQGLLDQNPISRPQPPRKRENNFVLKR